jgi:uncharacterized protein (TIGR00251 family)
MDIIEYLNDSTLEIIVRPNSSKNEIIGYDLARKALKVNIKAPPENNKANIELIKFLSKETKKKVKIISGFTSKKKVLRFR